MDPAALLPLASRALKASPQLRFESPDDEQDALSAMVVAIMEEVGTKGLPALSEERAAALFKRAKQVLIRAQKKETSVGLGARRQRLAQETAEDEGEGFEVAGDLGESARKSAAVQKAGKLLGLPPALVTEILDPSLSPRAIAERFPGITRGQVLTLRKAVLPGIAVLSSALTNADDMEEQIKSLLEFDVI